MARCSQHSKGQPKETCRARLPHIRDRSLLQAKPRPISSLHHQRRCLHTSSNYQLLYQLYSCLDRQTQRVPLCRSRQFIVLSCEAQRSGRENSRAAMKDNHASKRRASPLPNHPLLAVSTFITTPAGSNSGRNRFMTRAFLPAQGRILMTHANMYRQWQHSPK